MILINRNEELDILIFSKQLQIMSSWVYTWFFDESNLMFSILGGFGMREDCCFLFGLCVKNWRFNHCWIGKSLLGIISLEQHQTSFEGRKT